MSLSFLLLFGLSQERKRGKERKGKEREGKGREGKGRKGSKDATQTKGRKEGECLNYEATSKRNVASGWWWIVVVGSWEPDQKCPIQSSKDKLQLSRNTYLPQYNALIQFSSPHVVVHRASQLKNMRLQRRGCGSSS